MAKKLSLAILVFAAFFVSCKKDDQKATKPSYLSITDLDLKTDYLQEGSAHSKITTVWVFANDISIGVFNLPCVIPILEEGDTKIEVYAGVNMNGIDATRVLYSPYKKFEDQINLKVLDTNYLVSSGIPEINYSSIATIKIVEDFDQTGLNLVKTTRSDTGLYRSNLPSDVFVNPDEVEDNGKAGIFTLTGDQTFFEASTTDIYDLPQGSRSVFLEMTYKNEIPITIGVIAQIAGGTEQAQTIFLYESEEWNKIYINLVTEISSYPFATGFKIFIGGIKPSTMDSASVYLDNIKLAY